MAEILTAPGADRRLVAAWVAAQVSPRTRTAYAYEGARLLGYLACFAKPLRTVTATELQTFVATLDGMAPATIGLAVSAIKSLFAFGRLTGVLSNDPTMTLSAPPIKNMLAERILDEADVRRLIDNEPAARNRALLALFYGAGLRRAELCGLAWRDVTGRGTDRGQATVFGKGGKTRAVMLYGRAWSSLQAIRGAGGGAELSEGCGGVKGGRRLLILMSRDICLTKVSEQNGGNNRGLRHETSRHSCDAVSYISTDLFTR